MKLHELCTCEFPLTFDEIGFEEIIIEQVNNSNNIEYFQGVLQSLHFAYLTTQNSSISDRSPSEILTQPADFIQGPDPKEINLYTWDLTPPLNSKTPET